MYGKEETEPVWEVGGDKGASVSTVEKVVPCLKLSRDWKNFSRTFHLLLKNS